MGWLSKEENAKIKAAQAAPVAAPKPKVAGLAASKVGKLGNERMDQLEAERNRSMVREGERTVRDPNVQWGQPGFFKKEKYEYNDPEMEEQLRQSQFSSATRQMDIEKGQDRGRELFKDQLGRVEEPRSQAMAALLGKRKEQSEQGLGAEAFQAAREQRLRGLGSNELQQQRGMQAKMAQMGLRGGAAAGQMAELMGGQQRGRQDAEQQLLLQDVALKQGLMDKYGQQLGGVEAEELARKKFNLGQIGKEKFGELSTGLAEGSMGVAERTGAKQAEAAKAMQAAMAASGGGGGKK